MYDGYFDVVPIGVALLHLVRHFVGKKHEVSVCSTVFYFVYVNSTICMCELHCCFIQVFCAMHYFLFLAYGWSTAFYISKCTAFVLFVHFLTTIVKLHFDTVFVFHPGVPGFEDVTQFTDH